MPINYSTDSNTIMPIYRFFNKAHRRNKMFKLKSKLTVFFLIIFLTTALCLAGGGSKTVTADVKDISFYTPANDTETLTNIQSAQVNNVIFLIGDGMSYAQVTLARLKAAGQNGLLYMEKMPVTGYIKTHSANSLVTDSAAAGTALACGVKTNNKMIAMDPNETPYQTILEAAKIKGMKTGLVVTSTVTHATPASFASHVKSRKNEIKIAEHILQNRVNVILGGGKSFWLPESFENSKRKDEINLIAGAEQFGYSIIDNANQLANAPGPYVLGLFAMGPLTTISPEPTLGEMTENAIRILNKKPTKMFESTKGFFLMVEGSQIDWTGHKNDAHGNIKQTLLFDLAVKTALDFAMKDKKTLVIVTADHETGGLIVSGSDPEKKNEVMWATKSHSAMSTPVYAFGPGSQNFAGVYDNTEIPKRIANLLKTKPFPAKIIVSLP